jgi:ribokinase
MRYQFVSFGDITTDAFIKLKEGMHIDEAHDGNPKSVCLNFGDKIEYDSAVVIPGVGNAGNAAVSAQRLGLTTALVTDIGTDKKGEDCVQAWEKEGLSSEFVRRHAEYPTHYHYVLRYGAERTILIRHEPWPYTVPDFAEVPEWIYFTSIGEHGEFYHHDLAKYVKEHGVKLAFQPGSFQISLGADKIKDVYEVSEIFFCNKEEAQRILKTDEDDMVALMKGIRELGPNIAMVTDGPAGAFAMSDDGAWQIPMYPDPAPPVDRTGAGDAFASTVVAMLAQGMSLADAMKYGPINSMNVVQHIGAQEGLLTQQQIDSYLAQAPSEYMTTKIA